MSEDCMKCGTMMHELDEDRNCPGCSDHNQELLDKYEMYFAYYKDEYSNIVECVKCIYPELIQEDTIIQQCIEKIEELTDTIENRIARLSGHYERK